MNYSEAVLEITEVIPDFENELTKTMPQTPYSVIRTFTERIKIWSARMTEMFYLKVFRKWTKFTQTEILL